MADNNVTCDICGVRLSEPSMRFHRQVCGKQQSIGGPGGPPPRSTTPIRNNTGAEGVPTRLQPSNDAALQKRREEMRRNLNSLREEVYGKPLPSSGNSNYRPSAEEEAGLLRHSSPPKPQQSPVQQTQARAANLNAMREEIYGQPLRKPTPEELGGRYPVRQSEPPQVSGPPQATHYLPDGPSRWVENRVRQHDDTLIRLEHQIGGIREDLARQQQFLQQGLFQEREKDQQLFRQEVKNETRQYFEKLQDDTYKLGRHVDTLRDEVDISRTETKRIGEMVSRHEQSIIESEKQLNALQSSANLNVNSPRQQAELHRDMQELRSHLQRLSRDVELWRKENKNIDRDDRDYTMELRQDVRGLTKNIDSLHGEITDLRRQMDKDKRRMEERIEQRLLTGNIVPSSPTSNTRPISTPKYERRDAYTSPTRPPKSEHRMLQTQHQHPHHTSASPERQTHIVGYSGAGPQEHVVNSGSRRGVSRDYYYQQPPVPSEEEEMYVGRSPYSQQKDTERLVGRAVHRAYASDNSDDLSDPGQGQYYRSGYGRGGPPGGYRRR